MLCTYAPLETMDSAGEPRGVCGAGCRDLQKDRSTRRGPLFRSVGAWRPKDLYDEPCVGGIGRTVERECAGTGDPGHYGEAGVQHRCHYIAVRRTIIFRRRAHWSGSGPRSQPQGWRHGDLAFERTATRRPGTGYDSIHVAAPGSRHLCHRRNGHRSAVGAITEHAERDVLRPATLRSIAAAQNALARRLRQPENRFGR